VITSFPSDGVLKVSGTLVELVLGGVNEDVVATTPFSVSGTVGPLFGPPATAAAPVTFPAIVSVPEHGIAKVI
jgi:hypothetical protein